MKKHKEKNWIGISTTVLLFLAMFVIIVIGTGNILGTTNSEGLETTRQAIERATVLCYSSEGYYPPGLSYIESKYGVQIDHSRYAVRYEVFASNVMPNIRVVERGKELAANDG